MYYISKILFSDYLFLIPLLAIVSIAAWEDFKYGKIRNKWIKIGFLWGLGLFGLFILWSLSFWLLNKYFGIKISSLMLIKISYLKEVFLNAGIAFGVGFLMWRWNVWSAGDAKLFILCCFLLPLKFYSKTYLSYFPSFALLLNVFIVALTVFLISFVWSFSHWFLTGGLKRIEKKKLKQSAFNTAKEILNLCIVLFVMVGLLGLFKKKALLYVSGFLNLEKGALIIMFLGIFILLMRQLHKIKKIFYFLAVILVAILLYKWISLGQSPLLAIRAMLGVTSIIIFGGFAFRKMFGWYVRRKEIKTVRIEDLKPGMRLTEETLKLLREKGKKIFEKTLGRIYPDGLTKKQMPLLKEFMRKSSIKLKVYRPTPFAIWILAGVIITIIFKGAIIQSFLR